MKNVFDVIPGGALQGEWVIPGDKSISHRALIIGAMATGETILHGLLFSEDCLATLKALQQSGVVFHAGDEHVLIEGRGGSLVAPEQAMDCGNAGTSLRLLAGVLAGQPFNTVLIGDASLSRRPMKRIIHPLRQMGAEIEGTVQGEEDCAPLIIRGKTGLRGIHYTLPVASAQVKSCLLLAGLQAQGDTVLTDSTLTRDHTERLLRYCGADIQSIDGKIILKPGKLLMGREIYIPGDISSAAFFIVGASVIEGSHLLLRHVGINPTRTGILSILEAMGANIRLHNQREYSGEPVADIEVRYAPLKGVTVAQEWVVSAMDEFPIIFIAAALAQGTTTIRGLKELRYKETDRLGGMATALSALGVTLEVWEEGIAIEGGMIQGGAVDAKGDHRIAMAMMIAGMKAQSTITVQGADNIATSFPGFVELARQCGMDVR